MNIIELRNKDFDFLLESGIGNELVDKLKNNYSAKNNSVLLSLDREVVEQVLDSLGDQLAENGFNDNDEPNEFGIRVEGLIDKFSKVIYS